MGIDKVLDVFQSKITINYQRNKATIERRKLNKSDFILKLKEYGKFDLLVYILNAIPGESEIIFDVDELKKEISR